MFIDMNSRWKATLEFDSDEKWMRFTQKYVHKGMVEKR